MQKAFACICYEEVVCCQYHNVASIISVQTWGHHPVLLLFAVGGPTPRQGMAVQACCTDHKQQMLPDEGSRIGRYAEASPAESFRP